MPYKNLDKALLFLRNQVFVWKFENIKFEIWAPTILQFNIFCWNFCYKKSTKNQVSIQIIKNAKSLNTNNQKCKKEQVQTNERTLIL